MNFVSGIPVLFGFAMVTGGPTGISRSISTMIVKALLIHEAAFANWTMVGGFSFIVSLSMAELAASLPTAGGIYYWSYVLGGSEWGEGTALSEITYPDPNCSLFRTFSIMDDRVVELGRLGYSHPWRTARRDEFPALGFRDSISQSRYPG